MVTFNDIFKNSFLSGYSVGESTPAYILKVLFVVSILSLLVCFVYCLKSKEYFLSGSFMVSLSAMAVITAAIILAIQSNVVISLGMVGALSIVRFRTAIKNPLDLVFLFWSISIGIVCGAGLFFLAVILSVFVGIILLAFDVVPFTEPARIIVINAKYPCGTDDIMDVISRYARRADVKSYNLTNDEFDMVVDVRKLKQEQECIKELYQIDKVYSVAVMIQNDGRNGV